jgi:tetratricopeptide (TPR) repeat protein
MTQMYAQSPRVYYQLGQAYLMNSDFDKATANLRHALNLDPNFAEAIVLLAQIQIQNRNVSAAIPELENLVRRQPEQVEAQLLLAAAYRQNRQIDDAMAIYHSLEKSFPKNPQIPLLLGSAYAQQHNLAEARREFDRALAMAPDDLSALEQMVDLDLFEKQFSAAAQRVQSRLQADPKQLQLYMLLANVFSAEGKDDQSVAILQKGLTVFPDDPRISLFLAQTYFHANQNDQAVAQVDRVLAQDPKNLSALMLKAAVFGLNKDYNKQADIYEQVLQIDPNYSLALNNLADVYAEHLHQLDRAYDLAQRVHELLPFDPAVADTLGWISFLRGSYPTALGLIQGSAAQLQNDPEVQFHLGMVNYMSGNEEAARAAFQRALQINNGSEFSGRDECKTCLAILAVNPRSADAAALATLEKRIADKPGDPVALGRLAAVYQYQGNSDKAIASYEAILQIAPNNLMATLNLAQLYAAKDLAKAYVLAKAAYGLAPENPVAIHIYGRLAYQSGDFKLANALLQQALQNQTDDPQAFYDFGLSAYSLGKVSDARTAMQDALQINLPAPQSTEARRLLDLINLAADPAQAAAATARVSEILKSEPDYVPALMALGIIDEHNGDGPPATAAYEKILARYPDFSPAQRQLAILYSRNPARLSEAYDLATKAREVYPDDANLAKATGIILFLQNNYSAAISLLKGTAAVLPSDPEVFYYLGTAQLKLNENKEGRASLQAALNLKLPGQLADSARQMLAQLK